MESSFPHDTEALCLSFRALGHPHRLAIIRLLRERALACCNARRPEDCTLDPASCNVGEIVTHLGIPAPTASHHLKELVAAGLIDRARSGRVLFCRVNEARLAALRDTLTGVTA